MWNAKRPILVVILCWAVTGPLCWAGRNDALSGRELLRARRQRDRRSEKPPRRSREAGRTARTSRTGANNGHPTALELLDKYAETQDKLKYVIIKGETHYPSFDIVANGQKRLYEPRTAYEVGSDGERRYRRVRTWGNVSPIAPDVKKDAPHYHSRLWDGKCYYKYGGRLWIEINDPPHRDDPRFLADLLGGHFWGDLERVDSILRRSRRISVRDRLERVGGSQCYIIDAETERGKYTLWIDPRHGHNIAKMQNSKREGDVLRATYLDGVTRQWPVGKRARFYSCMQNVRFNKIEDVWVPMEADVEHRFDQPSSRITHFEGKKHIKRTEVILNPDHEALRSFYPDDIPSGTEIADIDWPRSTQARDELYKNEEDYFNFRWQPQAKSVVNESCRVVINDPKKQDLSVVKVLKHEDLVKDFELQPTPSGTKGKRTLLCFWDVKQEQSQQLLLTLRDRRAALTERGVAVMTVEASRAKTDKVRSWAEKNKVTFPVGTYYAVYEDFVRRQEDPEGQMPILSEVVSDLRMAWRIDRLPWLMLTDRDRVVTAEGFGLKELDAKIKETAYAKH